MYPKERRICGNDIKMTESAQATLIAIKTEIMVEKMRQKMEMR
jgi:hypothetical protein